MGGQQSTRRVSVDNDGSVQVSAAALDRIQQQLQEQPEQPRQDAAQSYETSQRRFQEHASEEAYWARRIENLRRTHDKINASMQVEYEKTLKEANALYAHAHDDKVAGKLPPCQQEKAKVLECYKANPDKSLVCSLVVGAFNDCVCNSRVSAVSAST